MGRPCGRAWRLCVAPAADRPAAASAGTRGPIVIGWAYDAKGQMAPFDGPALAAAKIRVEEINAKGGVDGRLLRIDTCDTQNNNPARAKSCAARLLGGGADVMFTTCDVDFATPVVQEAINRGVARGRAVHRHRPDGPEALRRDGAGSRSASATSRRTRARPWPSTRTARLADGSARDEHAARLLQERRAGVREALHAARRPRSSRARATRPARTTSRRRSAG